MPGVVEKLKPADAACVYSLASGSLASCPLASRHNWLVAFG